MLCSILVREAIDIYIMEIYITKQLNVLGDYINVPPLTRLKDIVRFVVGCWNTVTSNVWATTTNEIIDENGETSR